METKLIKIEHVEKDRDKLAAAAKILAHGGLVAFPTETVYGLGANGLDGEAAAKIYLAKGRPSDNPLILHVCDEEMLNRLVTGVSETARKLIKAFWPGPMTLVLRRSPIVPDRVTGGLATVAVRMPDHEIALALIKLAGVPLAAPSANTSGRPSPTDARTVLKDLSGKIDMVLDGGSCAFGLESTIIDCSGAEVTVLRPGAVTLPMIEAAVGRAGIEQALIAKAGAPKAPGMKYTHYAPLAPMILLDGPAGNMKEAFLSELAKAADAGKKGAVIVSRELADELPEDIIKAVYGKRSDLEGIAAKLYTALRSFDDKEIDVIFAEATSEEGIGMAVMNRLKKACGHRMIRV